MTRIAQRISAYDDDAYWRRLVRALFSSIIPGTGQLAAGVRRRGWAMVAVVAAVLVGGVIVVLQGVDQILMWWLEPSVLLALLVANAVLLLFRSFAVVDAFLARRSMRSPAGRDHPAPKTKIVITGVCLGLLLVLTIAPHAFAGYYTYVSYDLVTTVFADNDEKESPPTSVAASTTSIPVTSTSAATGGSTSTSPAPSTTAPTTTSTTILPVEYGDDERLTVMLIGTDEGYGRSGARADVIMVATFDLVTGRVALFSVPRNTGSVVLSESAAEALGTEVYVNLISSLYWDASQFPELAPEGGDPGAEVLRDALSSILGIPIDYYAVANMGGLVDLIDAFGGVTVNAQERVWVRLSPPTAEDEWQVYDIGPGIQHLTGLEALAFARSRTGSNDYVRMGRQRCVIAALLKQNGMAEIAWKFPAVAAVIKENVKTDLPIDALQALIGIRSELKSDEMITIGFVPPKFITGRNSMGYNILDLELVHSTVRQIIEHPEEVLATEGVDTGVDESDCWNFEE